MITSQSKHLVNFFSYYGLIEDVTGHWGSGRPSKYYLGKDEIRYTANNDLFVDAETGVELLPHKYELNDCVRWL